MDADGHTAALFPGTTALRVNDRVALANHVEKFNPGGSRFPPTQSTGRAT
jgi:hypothetical protein